MNKVDHTQVYPPMGGGPRSSLSRTKIGSRTEIGRFIRIYMPGHQALDEDLLVEQLSSYSISPRFPYKGVFGILNSEVL